MKKILATILALMMLALPLTGLAEGDFIAEAVAGGRMVENTTTFHLAETGNAALDTVLEDLLKALVVKSYWQEGDAPQGGVIVSLSGRDILTIEVAQQDSDTYLSTDLLGGTIVVGADESQVVAEKLINLFVALEAIDADEAAELLASLNTGLNAPSTPFDDIDFEAMMAGFENPSEELLKLLEEIAGRVEESDPTNLPKLLDGNTLTAAKAYTVTLTADDIVKVYAYAFESLKGNAEYMKLLDAIMMMGGVSSNGAMSGEEMIDEMQRQLETALPEAIQGDIPLTVYLDDADELAAMYCDFDVRAGDDAETAKVVACYARNLVDGDVAHTFVCGVLSEDQAELAAGLTMQVLLAGTDEMDILNAFLTLVDEEETAEISLAAARSETETTKHITAGLTVNAEGTVTTLSLEINAEKNGVDAQQTIKFVVGDDLFSMTTESRTTDPAASIATDDAVRLAQLSDEEMQAWFTNVTNSLQLWVITVLQSLPQSVLMLLN